MKPALILALALSACTSLVPSTFARLASLSPLEADPGQIEVTLLLPQGLRVRPDGATLAFEGTQAKPARAAMFWRNGPRIRQILAAMSARRLGFIV